jgi:cellulose synthase/poly-beta-1,6-N-acetylglucosamine synthase-like glycosyltransferase
VLFCTAQLFFRAFIWMHSNSRAWPAEQLESDRFWVFMVPALDEERVIADSVSRLLQVKAARKLIFVINDGSTDGTAAALDQFADEEEVMVLTRTEPDARVGKSAALNQAYGMLKGILAERDIDRSEVITAIIDADGRLDDFTPLAVGRHFEDDRVGGVQVRVAIYNRESALARLQDVELSMFGYLYQAGRSGWGTAAMGGNGQFNRLTALDSITNEEGPWRHTLTEDQDLGLRLISAGWRGSQELDAAVNQQGVPSPSRLFRQRVRWCQGNLQAMALFRSCLKAEAPLLARMEIAVYLLMPFLQVMIFVAFIVAMGLAITGTAVFWGGSWGSLVFVYLLGFGGVLMGCTVRGYGVAGVRGFFVGIAQAQLLAVYSWFISAVLMASLVRHARGQTGWVKTAREAI